MTISIDSNSSTPPFEQVRATLAAQIVDGTLATGTKLPTVRALATDLALAANTVARAYRELEGAGLIETHGRAGSFVGAAGDASRQSALEAAADYARAVHALGIARAEALAIVTAAIENS